LSRAVRILIAAALSALGLGVLAAPASAGIWTPVDSSTTQNITAIDYQSDERFWIATAGGQIRYREGGVFKPAAGLTGSITFNDIAFQPGTNVGLAVGNGDNVWRSTDGGRNWTKLDPKTINNASCGSVPNIPVDPGDIFTIAWGANNAVYLGGAGRTVLRSQDAGLNFTEVNKTLSGCRLPSSVPGVSDMFFFPGSTMRSNEALYLQARDAFGKIYYSSDGLLSAAQPRDESINGTETNTNLAVDPVNTNRLWATNQCGFTCLYASEDSAASFACVCTIRNEGSENQIAWYDVEFAGGTIVAAGRGGQIVNSIDGVNFFYNKADGALTTKDWLAVAMASGTAAAVGGQGGSLVVTGSANFLPDIEKPTGTISGPGSAVAGQPVTFTLNAADTGGSGLNPASYAWTSAGLPGQSGNPVAFTFPSPGFYTVRVNFADNAGNSATATKSISVSQATGGGGSGGATPTFSLSGPGNSATAKIVGNRVRVRMRGTIKAPPGVSTAAACNGNVRLTIKKKRKTLHRSRAKLKLKKGRCRFGKTVFIKRSKVGNTTRLRLKLRFKGNSVLKAGQTTKTLVVKK
jgi:Photosynthesis system II assembly factor YCF48/PKD domain